jgi:DNA (cytosine-5)-methyltransferase 1
LRPVLLDLYCGAGGAARGYQEAGFYVVGVDLHPQPRYAGDEFVQMDALEYLETADLSRFSAIHASPPCQRYTALSAMWNAREHPDLVPPTRERLREIGLPYVIENVPGAPMQNYVTLCGSMFGLGTGDAELRRHRLFEIEPPMLLVPPCGHNQRPLTASVYGHAGGSSTREKLKSRVIGVYGGHGRDRRRRFNTQGFSTEQRREAMGIDWMTGEELSESIPPAYTAYIGAHLLRVIEHPTPEAKEVTR